MRETKGEQRLLRRAQHGREEVSSCDSGLKVTTESLFPVNLGGFLLVAALQCYFKSFRTVFQTTFAALTHVFVSAVSMCFNVKDLQLFFSAGF